ncbi:MAG: trypsin-like peptidase domain-containing protein [Candidatus Eisenbacteria bacterium]|nr:trypsin-like peptidase domain-containing protein [Candidatus Eisenbacteria bacterium]
MRRRFLLDSRAARYIIIALIFVVTGISVGLLVTVRALREQSEQISRIVSGQSVMPILGEDLGGGQRNQAALSLGRQTALVRAAQGVGPATVSISAVKTRVVRTDPMGTEFFDRFFRGHFPGRTYMEPYQSFGSGVIVDGDGYILTNEHVVGGATQVRVTLTDGREFEARVLGDDSRFDLAVLKIDGEDLPVAELGDSEDLMIGEWVVAIGNPFGHFLNDPHPTVTAGVISALHRDVLAEGESDAIYKDMIQTDASINPGNSGGPLVNSAGEVIGVNSFIFTTSGGSEGLGFAIPINVARLVINELLEFGHVRDVWVGMRVQDITPALVQSLGLPAIRGVVTSFLEPGSPAERAGVRAGDIVVAVNGRPIDSVRQARRAIFGSRVGDTISVTVLRAGERRDFNIKLEEVPH